MAQYNKLKKEIDTKVYENHCQLVTGKVFNGVLKDMIDALGKGSQFMGLATPDTNPHSGDAKMFYLAKEVGVYEHFANLEVLEGEIAFFTYDVEWAKISIPTSAPMRTILLNKYNPYLYEVLCPVLDYDYAKAHIGQVPVSAFACSSFKKGSFVGRNFDWKYDNSVEFIVRSEGVVGVAGCIPNFDADYAAKGEWLYNEKSKLLPFFMQDGVNAHGVFASVHVVKREINSTERTIPSEALREEMPSLMLVRYILDHFATAKEAVEYIRDYVSILSSPTLREQGYDLHWFVADKESSYVMEIAEGEVVILEKDAMTNFLWYGVTPKADGTLYSVADVPAHIPSIENNLTHYAQGVERYNLIAKGDSIENLLKALAYSHTYTLTSDIWFSEFVGEDLTIDSEPSAFTEVVTQAKWDWEHRSREEGKVWHTKHSCLYDLANLGVRIVSQDGDEAISKEPISVTLLGFDTTDIEQAIIAEEQRAIAKENEIEGKIEGCVRYDQQTLTEEQKTQARKNIGAESLIVRFTVSGYDPVKRRNIAYKTGGPTFNEVWGALYQGIEVYGVTASPAVIYKLDTYEDGVLYFSEASTGTDIRWEQGGTITQGGSRLGDIMDKIAATRVTAETTRAIGAEQALQATINGLVGREELFERGAVDGSIVRKNANNTAEGVNSLILGSNCSTSVEAFNSLAEGYFTETTNPCEHSEGLYNKSNSGTRHSVGIGKSGGAFNIPATRINAHEIMNNGDHYIYGVGGYDGTNPESAQTLQAVINELVDALETEELVLKSGASDANKVVYDLLAVHPQLAKEVVYFNSVTATYYKVNSWKQITDGFAFTYLRVDGSEVVVVSATLDSNGRVA